MESTIEVRDVLPKLRSQLDQRAREEGVDRQTFVLRLLERELSPAERTAKFDSILAPLRQAVADTGMSEEEIQKFVQSEIDAVRRERRERPCQS